MDKGTKPVHGVRLSFCSGRPSVPGRCLVQGGEPRDDPVTGARRARLGQRVAAQHNTDRVQVGWLRQTIRPPSRSERGPANAILRRAASRRPSKRRHHHSLVRSRAKRKAAELQHVRFAYRDRSQLTGKNMCATVT